MKYKVPLEIINTPDGGCHIFIQVKFEPITKGWMIVDTGANKTVFDKQKIVNHASFGDIINDEISSGISASIGESQYITIRQLSFNKFSLKNFETIAIDLHYLNELYQRISKKEIWGLLGGDFLLKHDCFIDYKEKCLTLSDDID